MKLFALKGMLVNRNEVRKTYYCGTYVVTFIHSDCPVGFVMDLVEDGRIFNETSFRNLFENPRFKTKRLIKKKMFPHTYDEVIRPLENANIFVHGEGETLLDAFTDILSKVALASDTVGFLDLPPEEQEIWNKKIGINKLSDKAKALYEFILKKNHITSDFSPYAVHNKRMYKKTYVTYDTIKAAPEFTFYNDDYIKKCIYTLYTKGLISFYDITPRYEVKPDGTMPLFVIDNCNLIKEEVKIKSA